MTDALFWHRLHFGFTVTYHYLFPQLTMGLAFLIVLFKWRAFRAGSALHADAARFWARIFGVSFALGVVTGIPMEFQFGTNWARFSQFAGGVIGQTLAMEGVFAFFLESTFLGLFLYGEKRFGPRLHLASAIALWVGSWLSGYFIIATNAFMQNPVGHTVAADGRLQLADFWAFVLNPWAIWQYLHNMTASVVTASFVVAGVGAFWMLSGVHREHARLALRTGVIAGLVASCLMIFPTGDRHGKLLAEKQPATLAAMEGLFESKPDAELAIIGQPDVDHRRLENPVVVPGMLSFLVYGSFGSTVTGLDAIPTDRWPDNIELLYYAYHVMAGLGTLFIALLSLAALQLWRGRLETSPGLLWALMLAMPFPYIATTAGWMTAEMGRQPWLVYGLMRTAEGTSPRVSAGNTLFTLLGFAGLYLVMGVLFLYLVGREIAHGPGAPHGADDTGERPVLAEEGDLMEALWFAIVAGMLAVYVVLDGFDFGAGFLHLFVARTDAERRTVLAAIGPVWDGNEVWLVAGGGALFLAFPTAYAVGFSGFYMPLMMLLWVLILRGLAIELRSHVSNALWASFWDVTFALGSTLIAVVLGAALGNVLRGVPLDATGTFHIPLFDSFWPGKDSGVLDAYTVLVGGFTLLALGGHGGLYLAVKTEGNVHARSERAARLLWIGAGALFPLVTWATVRVAPELQPAAAQRPLVWVLSALLTGLAAALVLGLVRGRADVAFLGSAGTLLTLLGTGAAARWPVLLRSSVHPRLSLDAFAAATTNHGLRVALAWAVLGLPLACGYFVFLGRLFRGKVRLDGPAPPPHPGSSDPGRMPLR